MQSKKAILLAIALLLPISIFIFLKLFGRNEFDVKPFYETEVPPPSADCKITYARPYVVDDTVMAQVRKSGVSRLYLIRFSEGNFPGRIGEEMDSQVRLVAAQQLANTPEAVMQLKSCVFILRSNSDLVLIDDQQRIRGFYNSSYRDDVDRLLMETEILLKKY